MRVLLVAPTLDAGGAERQLVVLANKLAERGHDMAVVLFRATGPLLDDLVPSVHVHDLKKQGRWDFVGFIARAYRCIRGQDPDVVYSFLGVPNLLTVLLRAAIPGLRVVWSVRAADMDLSRYDWLVRTCYYVECLLSRFSHAVIANSHSALAYAVSNGFPQGRMYVVPNGFDTERFKPDRALGRELRQSWGGAEGNVLVGLVARVDPMKDHETFLRAASLAAEGDANLRFVCVGPGDPALQKKLASLTMELGLAERLVWAGSQSSMEQVYNALDVVCLSSVTESFPNVLGEAMACGIPCITTDVGDASIIVGDKGIVVPPRAPGAMARAIGVMSGPGFVSESNSVRTRIVEQFSIDAMVEGTESLFKSLVARDASQE